MAVRFPSVPRRLGLGVGLDLPWGPNGLVADPDGGDRLAPRVHRFFAGEAACASHVFFSWQRRDRARLRLDDYRAAWDDLWSAVPAGAARALHHTALNLGAVDGYRRGALLDFTNALIDRYALQWVNEDLGLWSLAGKPLPYPLPPYLTDAGLRAAVQNVDECQRALAAPLSIEFPGFAQGVSVIVGPWDAYDYLRALAEATDSPVTLDLGHLLSWRWLRGLPLYEDLERLPLAHCFELHLSGCEVAGDRFIDAHHGVLLPEQLELLRLLLPRCPNLRAITYEDPRIDEDGALVAANRQSFAALAELVAPWAAAPASAAEPATPAVHEIRGDDDQADVMLDLLRTDPELAELTALMRRQLVTRAHRGTGTLVDAFPRTIAAWRAAHPDDAALDGLAAAFLASPAATGWREASDDQPGALLEEAFADFADGSDVGDADVRRGECAAAIARVLTVCPAPAFTVPDWVRPCPRGWFAIAPGPVLHAAVAGRYLTGPITPLLARLLTGGDDGGHEAARTALIALGLLADTAPSGMPPRLAAAAPPEAAHLGEGLGDHARLVDRRDPGAAR